METTKPNPFSGTFTAMLHHTILTANLNSIIKHNGFNNKNLCVSLRALC